jgi:hypothetical protein
MTLILLILRLLGLSGVAEDWLARREAEKQAQATADAPTTRNELEKTLRDGDL